MVTFIALLTHPGVTHIRRNVASSLEYVHSFFKCDTDQGETDSYIAYPVISQYTLATFFYRLISVEHEFSIFYLKKFVYFKGVHIGL